MTAIDEGRDIYGPHAMKLSWPTRVVLGGLAVMGVAAVGFGFASNQSDSAQERSDEVAACYRNLRAPIDSTDAALGRATTQQTVLFFGGLVALVRDDEAALNALLLQEPAARAKVEAASKAKDEAVAAYERAAKLPVDQLLKECRSG